VAGGLIILDRDGVINHNSADFIRTPDEWLPIEGSVAAIASLCGAGFTVAVATNQSGIGRKLIDLPALKAMHEKMRRLVRDAGGDIARIECCPHHPDDGCDCRKPAPGLYKRLARQFGVALDGVPVIGDSVRDLEAAIAVGARPMLVLTGNGQEAAATLRDGNGTISGPVETFADLAAAAALLISERADPHRFER
jgi:D-glycero-D-manno-heptose 1,7-bisphosphate phosphatase